MVFSRLYIAITASLIGHAALLMGPINQSANFSVDTSAAKPSTFQVKLIKKAPQEINHRDVVSTTFLDKKSTILLTEDQPEVAKLPQKQAPMIEEQLEETPQESQTEITQSVTVQTPDVMPSIVKNMKPKYPRIAKKNGYEGTVLLKVEILKDGKVGNISIATSSGYDMLDQAAIESIQKWKFSPAKKQNECIDQWVNLPINFDLKKG